MGRFEDFISALQEAQLATAMGVSGSEAEVLKARCVETYKAVVNSLDRPEACPGSPCPWTGHPSEGDCREMGEFVGFSVERMQQLYAWNHALAVHPHTEEEIEALDLLQGGHVHTEMGADVTVVPGGGSETGGVIVEG